MEKNIDALSVYLNNEDVFASVLHAGKWPVDEGLNLIHDFVVERLPDALITYDPEKGNIKGWLYVVFSRYAKKRQMEISSRSKREIDFDSISELYDQNNKIDNPLTQLQQKEVAIALRNIDREHSTALKTYFGSGPNSGKVRALAREYNWSRHKAERIILEGLAMLAAQLDEPGILTDEEMKVCKYYFIEKKTWCKISELIKKTEHQSRGILKNSFVKFKNILK